MFRNPIAMVAASMFLLGSLASNAVGDGKLWQTDFEAAKAQALQEKKFLLVNFTGSDWCVFCKLLGKEVLDTEVFKSEAPKQFVLVELDFPNQTKLPMELVEQNQKLRKLYGVTGFPTILLVDPQGEAVAKQGYLKGTAPGDYLQKLSGLLSIHEELIGLKKKLADVQGLERAQVLDRIIGGNEKLGRETEEMAKFGKEIIELDANNEAKLKSKHAFHGMLVDARNLIRKEKKLAEAIALLEEGRKLPGITPEQIQVSYVDYEGECRFYMKDYVGLVASLKKGMELAPESENFPRIESLLKRFGPLGEAQSALLSASVDLKEVMGSDRAKKLDRLIDAQTKLLDRFKPNPKDQEKIEEWKEEILALDGDNQLGFKTKYLLFPRQMKAANGHYNAKDFEKVHAVLAEALKLPGLSGEQSQNARHLQGVCYLAQNEPKKGIECFERALEDAPEGPFAGILQKRIEIAKKSLGQDSK